MKQLDRSRDQNSKIPKTLQDRKYLYIIGYGINYSADRSILAEQYINNSEVIFTLESDIAHIQIEIHGKPLKNLINLYRQGISREIAYEQIAEEILSAFSNHIRIGLLVEGSPFFLDSINELLEYRAGLLGIEIVYVDGRSSLDVLIQTLRIPLKYGIGAYLAEDFCESASILNSEAINLFFQPANVGSELIQIEDVNKAGVGLLQQMLLKFYDNSQRWFLVNLGHSSTISTKIIWQHLNNLDSFHQYMHSGTLVVSKNWWPTVLHDVPATKIRK